MSNTGAPTRADLRAVIAGGFTALAVAAAGNAAAMLVLRAHGYGTLPLAAGAAVYAAATAWCAVGVRAGRARSLRGPVALWVASGLGTWMTVALTYRPGAMFWIISVAALATWSAVGVWARRRLRGRGVGVHRRAVGGRRRAAPPPVAPLAVRPGGSHVGTAGVPARTGVRPAAGV